METEHDKYENLTCELCHYGNNEHLLILCDECDYGYHTYCIGLEYKVPSGTWYCPKCTYSNNKVNTSSIYKGTNVHIYERVSSYGQDKPEYGRVGANVQNAAILDFCSKNDMIVASTTREIGSAFKTGKTPKLDALINKVKKGEPIIVYSVSRFSRNNKNALNMINKLHNKWSYVWSITEGIKSYQTEFKKYLESSENESKMLSDRIICSNKRIVEARGFNGKKKPFGYLIYRDENGIRRLKEHPLEQEVMKIIKDIYYSNNYQNNFTKFHNIINSEFNRYRFTKLDLKHIINDHYKNKCTVIPTQSFVKDMIQALSE